MLDFMDYIQLAFAEKTNWNCDNSFSSLTATAQSLLEFSTPERFQIHLSSLATPHFATSYTLGTLGLLDGSVSYLFTTESFEDTSSKSGLIPLRKICPGYRQVSAPVGPAGYWSWESLFDRIKLPGTSSSVSDDVSASLTSRRDQEDLTTGVKATLMYASLHLPPPTTLNALFLRRLSPTTQLSLAVSSTSGPPLSKSAPQASLLTQLSHDTGKYSNEYLFSTDNALFGWRGLWNFGPDPRTCAENTPLRVSLLSAGAEAYYSPISSLVGMSTGLRFSTLPAATEIPLTAALAPSSSSTSPPHGAPPAPISTFPYTLTLTLTPLTGSLSTTYSVRASPNLSFSSLFGFNVYSWESEMIAGCELWRQTKKTRGAEVEAAADDGLEWARRKMRETGWGTPPLVSQAPRSSSPPATADDGFGESVIKLRFDQSLNIRILWEARIKALLVSAGVELGPSSFSLSSSSSSSAATLGPGAQSSGGGHAHAGFSYWRGVGVSVSYSS